MNLGEAMILKDKVLSDSRKIIMGQRRKKMEFYSVIYPRFFRQFGR